MSRRILRAPSAGENRDHVKSQAKKTLVFGAQFIGNGKRRESSETCNFYM